MAMDTWKSIPPPLFQLGGDKLIDPKIVNTFYKVPCILADIILLRSIEKKSRTATIVSGITQFSFSQN